MKQSHFASGTIVPITRRHSFSTSIWPKSAKLPQRRDEIWKHSCFEVFWGEFSDTSYWELNLNPSQHWNLYRFQSERSPQPPTPDHTFVVEGIQWAATKAEVLVRGPWGSTGFQGTFCAVTELANEKLYWATTHSSSKPDFHRRIDWQQRF